MTKNDYIFTPLARIPFYSILILFLLVGITNLILCCILKLLYPNVSIGDCASFFTAVIALFAFIITINEYYAGKDAKQAQILSEYNKRYTEDPNIVKVVKYLNYIHEDGTINNPHREKPSNYEVEMFMRFFEELEHQIEKGRLSEKDVYSLFAYYANFLGSQNNEELRLFLGITKDDYDKHWSGFKKISNQYNSNS